MVGIKYGIGILLSTAFKGLEFYLYLPAFLRDLLLNLLKRPGNVGNYGVNFTMRHPLSLWKAKNDEKMTLLKVWSPGRSVVGRSLLGRSISGLKYAPSQSILWAEVFPGPKYSLGRSNHRAEVSVGPKMSLGQTGCEPEILGVSISLGNLDQARNPTVIKDLGITHIASIGR